MTNEPTIGKPLLGLCMIVKDEARGIVQTLRSVDLLIDYATVVDTGSTDDTVAIVKTTLEEMGVEHTLYSEPFVDFTTTRNRALELHGDRTELVLMVQGDDVIVFDDGPSENEAKRVRDQLVTQRAAGGGVWNMTRVMGSTRFRYPFVFASADGWHFKGRTHEQLTCNNPCSKEHTLDGIKVVRPQDGTPKSKRERWLADLSLLNQDLYDDPMNARTHFYLAQTHECLGDLQQALRIYTTRSLMTDGWWEETYEAKFRIARVMQAMGVPWIAVQQAYLDAHAFCPARAEPLHEIAKHWYDERSYSLCYVFATRAACLAIPNAKLFVDQDVYVWKAADLVAISAWWLAKHLATENRDALLAVGAAAARSALAARPDDERIRVNAGHYQAAGWIAGSALPTIRDCVGPSIEQ